MLVIAGAVIFGAIISGAIIFGTIIWGIIICAMAMVVFDENSNTSAPCMHIIQKTLET